MVDVKCAPGVVQCFACDEWKAAGTWIPEGEFICADCSEETRKAIDADHAGQVAEERSRLALLEAVVATLPTCEKQAHPEASNSPYICKRFATRTTVLDGDDPSYTRAFCDEHVPRFMRADDLVDLNYAAELRALEAAR